MNTRTPILAATIGSLIVAGAASAESVNILGLDEGLQIESVSMTHLFSGSTNHGFTDLDVRGIHEVLHDANIVTEARVTFLLVESAEGLSFVTLIDDHLIHGTQAAELSLITTAPETTNFWVNDFGGDISDWYTEDGETTAIADFRWIRGDAFAWSGFQPGDEASFAFSPSGDANNLTAESPYQFVTPSETGWDVVWSGNYAENGELAFDIAFAGTPAPGAIALLCVAGITGFGRRRRH